MKLINILLLASTTKDTEINELRLPENPSQVTDKKRIQVLSVAVHGGQIEGNTEKFAYKLYEEAIEARKESVLYSFISNINTIRSGGVKSDRCITIHCCKTIEDKNGKVAVNSLYKNGNMCASFRKRSVDKCSSENICYLNAAHVTSENFMTDKLNEVLKDRYPVSFHGYQDRNADDGKLVHMVLGGRSNQKFKLAEEFYRASNKPFRIGVCKTAKNCEVYDPVISPEQRAHVDGSHITGLSTKNFANKGKNNCGIQIELSATFRNSTRTSADDWNTFIKSIIKTLPENDGKFCQ